MFANPLNTCNTQTDTSTAFKVICRDAQTISVAWGECSQMRSNWLKLNLLALALLLEWCSKIFSVLCFSSVGGFAI